MGSPPAERSTRGGGQETCRLASVSGRRKYTRGGDGMARRSSTSSIPASTVLLRSFPQSTRSAPPQAEPRIAPDSRLLPHHLNPADPTDASNWSKVFETLGKRSTIKIFKQTVSQDRTLSRLPTIAAGDIESGVQLGGRSTMQILKRKIIDINSWEGRSNLSPGTHLGCYWTRPILVHRLGSSVHGCLHPR